MTSQPISVADRANPVHRFGGAALAALERLMETPAWAMTVEEQAEALVELTRVHARVSELRWRVISAADRNEIGAKEGATSTAAWLARHTRETRMRTNADSRGALALDSGRFEVTRTALAAGDLNEDQVRVIHHAIDDLPSHEVPDDQRVLAQRHLVALAAEHDAKQLRILARRIFEGARAGGGRQA